MEAYFNISLLTHVEYRNKHSFTSVNLSAANWNREERLHCDYVEREKSNSDDIGIITKKAWAARQVTLSEEPVT